MRITMPNALNTCRATCVLLMATSLLSLAAAAPPGYVKRTIELDAPPVGLAFDADGTLFALENADGNIAALRVIPAGGVAGASYPISGGNETTFYVGGMAYDPVGDRLLISDNTTAANGRLYAVSKTGVRETEPLASGIANIAGIAVRSSGEIFVTAAPGASGELLQVDRITGDASEVFPSHGSLGLGFGAGLAFDLNGDLIVQDSDTTTFAGRLQRLPITSSGGVLTIGAPQPLLAGMISSAGVIVDSENEIFTTGGGGLYRVSGGPLPEQPFDTKVDINGNPTFATAVAFHAGENPFEPFAGPNGGQLAFMANFGFDPQTHDDFITLLSPAAAEDFNSDGDVDGEDLALWAANYGTPAAQRQQGDADADGDVDGHDFLRWQRALAAPASLAVGVGASSAIPEPPSSIAFLLAAAPFAWQTRKRR